MELSDTGSISTKTDGLLDPGDPAGHLVSTNGTYGCRQWGQGS
jgi:hypothetical protein